MKGKRSGSREVWESGSWEVGRLGSQDVFRKEFGDK